MKDSIQNYREITIKLKKYLEGEGSSYRLAGIILLVIGAICLIFLWILGVILIFGAFYLFVMSYKSYKNIPFLYSAQILDKKHYRRKMDKSSANEETKYNNRYEFRVLIRSKGKMTPYKLEEMRPEKAELMVYTNWEIYNSFSPGTEFRFVLSPANDLIGYFQDGAFKLLSDTRELSNGEKMAVSLSIPQDDSAQDWIEVVESSDQQ